MNENDLRVIKTKKALHQALLTLLRSKALESISVSALCREAKVNRGTFYLHYPDVGALFDEHLKHLLKDLEESYYEPYRHVSRLIPRDLDPSTIRIFHHVKKYQPFYEIVFDKKSTLSYYYSLFEKIKGLMRESNSFHETDEKDLALVIAYQANAIMGLLIQWSEDGFARSPEYMNEQLTFLLRSASQAGASQDDLP
ncbi:TetR/AcrR family transcriptional regulator [Cohnella algarum]|uniref:TetR/AcrR family transcriptional regulator n=1 Tax=Cohnella algarum TaxID=2044859 RepID=UPI0019675826|nr:TetR/AcrR family transcriptional regulator [Cohnella algarum]MBN2983729.1 TetR/AcrR family transcriptional regulator C-terminal domain-containing protein [Cohnella algarum]